MINAILSRIKSIEGIKHVGVLVDPDKTVEEITEMPAVFIIPTEETADTNRTIYNATSQRVLHEISLEICVANYRDSKGHFGFYDLQKIRDAIKDSIYGWSPTTETTPLFYNRGTLKYFTDRIIVWSDSYSTTSEIQSQNRN